MLMCTDPQPSLWIAVRDANFSRIIGTCVHFALSGVSNIFQLRSNPTPMCHHCGAKPVMFRATLDSLISRTVRMFKCERGDQAWPEDKGKAAPSVRALYTKIGSGFTSSPSEKKRRAKRACAVREPEASRQARKMQSPNR
jgi:hypothetical protein